jgi:hypothetical protein
MYYTIITTIIPLQSLTSSLKIAINNEYLNIAKDVTL